MEQQDNSSWQYKPDGGAPTQSDGPANGSGTPSAAKRDPLKSIAWEAPEFMYHPHGPGWYTLLIIITVALSALVYILSKDRAAAVIIAVLGVIVGAFASQKPKQVRYEITDSGLNVNDKLYSYSNFKSFAVIRQDGVSGVNLFPLKRLMPPVSAYFDPKEEQKIIQALGNYLPFEPRKLDAIDRLSRRLRL